MPPPRLVEYPEDDQPGQVIAGAKAGCGSHQACASPAIATASSSTKGAKGESKAPTHVLVGRDDDDDQVAPQAAVKLSFPGDLGQWLPDDFRSAHKQRFTRLTQAVRELGPGNEWNPDADENARLLGELLEPVELPATAPPPRRKPVGYDDEELPPTPRVASIPGLSLAIVESLGVNGGEEARQILKRILLGKQPSEIDDRQLTIASLRTLVDHFDPENQRVVLAVLSVPGAIRPPGRGPLTAEQLQDECLKLVRPIATDEFRLQMARRLSQSGSSPNSRRKLLDALLDSDPRNLAAQVELYVSGQLTPTDQLAIERQLAPRSGQVLERLLKQTLAEWEQNGAADLRSRANSSDAVDRQLSLNTAVEQAAQLWRADFAHALADRIASTEDLQPNQSLLSLIASLPTDELRRALVKRWKDHWANEADLTAGLIGGIARDPGLVVVLKNLPREAPNLGTRDTSSRLATDSPQGVRIAKEQNAKKTWLRTSERLVRALADRCKADAEYQASVSSAKTTTVPMSSVADFDRLLNSTEQPSATLADRKSVPSESLAVDLGLRLPKAAHITSTYCLNWPEAFQDRLPASCISSLSIKYLRMECDGMLDAIAKNFARQLKSAPIRSIDSGRWIDALSKIGVQKVRSTDILITSTAKDGDVAKSLANEKLIVEVLAIEVIDPAAENRTSAALTRSAE